MVDLVKRQLIIAGDLTDCSVKKRKSWQELKEFSMLFLAHAAQHINTSVSTED